MAEGTNNINLDGVDIILILAILLLFHLKYEPSILINIYTQEYNQWLLSISWQVGGE